MQGLKKILKEEYVISFFPDLKTFHVSKDVGQIPYFIGKNLGVRCAIVKYENDTKIDSFKQIINEFAPELEIIELKKISFLWHDVTLPLFILKNRKFIKVFYYYQFGFSIPMNLLFLSLIFKKLNPSGKLHIKFEADAKHLGLLPRYPKIKSFFIRKYFNIIDIFGTKSVEKTHELFKPFKKLTLDKIKLQFNGFNSEILLKSINKVNQFNDKSKIICTSGRIDESVKGLDILLMALNQIDLGDWEVHLYGGDKEKVNTMVNSYLDRDIKKKVKIYGTVPYSELYKGINNSMVYILSSYQDGMPIAITEAMALGNLIISANHYGMLIALKGGELGRLFEIGNSEQLAKVLQETIDDELYIAETITKSTPYAWNNFSWDSIIKSIYNS